MFASLAEPATWISLASLAALEIVLGIDNIVFISILTAPLPRERRGFVRRLGLSLALVLRLGLLGGLTWLMGLSATLARPLGHPVTGRDLVLLAGGLFLIGKSTHEIFVKVEGDSDEHASRAPASAASALAQILALDVVFSLDSVITAVGLAPRVWVMVAAMVIAVGVMVVFANAVGEFIARHPSMAMLALSFLLLVGVLLVAEGLGQHVNRGYVYFAMAFSLAVELLNIRMRKRPRPLALHGPQNPR